jgi:hypothetical protein
MGIQASHKDQQHVFVHGSIPHHERKTRHLENPAPVRPEVSKGERRLDPSCRLASKGDLLARFV